MVDGADHKQMWFAGVHADVGGGYAQERGRLARIPLRWMLGEAKAAGLNTNANVEELFALDATYREDEQAAQNESLSAMWRALEFLPLPHREQTATGWQESRRIYACKGWRKIVDTYRAQESLSRRRHPIKDIHWNAALSQITFGT